MSTMHFGPEWMRTKHQPARSQQPPSPPPSSHPTASSGASSYSALVSSAPPSQPEKDDVVHPFRYSREEMLRIYKEGGGKGGLGLEVERWEGVVREAGSEPIGLRELSDTEKKLFAGPLNSDLRRRQSTDFLSPLVTQSQAVERSRLSQPNSASAATASPLRERFGALRRRDSTDNPTQSLPRKQSLSSLQLPSMSPRDSGLPSPRTRGGYTPGFDGVLNNGESWVSRRRASESTQKSNIGPNREGGNGDQPPDTIASEIREEEEEEPQSGTQTNHESTSNNVRPDPPDISTQFQSTATTATIAGHQNPEAGLANSLNGLQASDSPVPFQSFDHTVDLTKVEWSYKDPSGQIQGPFPAELMQKWYDEGYFAADLPMRRTHYDTQWILVEDLARQSAGGKIFLTPPFTNFPPGLSKHTESMAHGLPQDPYHSGGPYQPAPVRNLRSATLDAYMGTGSSSSGSPPSSISTGQFGNGSPDPSAFGGRAHNYPGDGSRVLGYPANQDFSGARHHFNDSPMDSGQNVRSNFGSAPQPFGAGIETFPNTAYNPSWQPHAGHPSAAYDLIAGRSVDPRFSNLGSSNALGSGLAMSNQHVPLNRNGPYQPYDYSALGDAANQHMASSDPRLPHTFPAYAADGSLPSNLQQAQGYLQPGLGQYSAQQSIPQSPHPHAHHQQTSGNSVLSQNAGQAVLLPSAPHSHWDTHVDESISRTFENVQSSVLPTPVMQTVPSSQPSPWGRTNEPPPQSTPQSADVSPWLATSQPVEGSWLDSSSKNLTLQNIVQHNQHQQQLTTSEGKQRAAQPPKPLITDAQATTVSPPPVKTRTKSSGQGTTAKLSATATVSPIESSTQSQNKPAWTKEEEASRLKSSGTAVSLREIQEAEAKKAETRKAADRERERMTRTASSASDLKDETFTASWGLPTSQAGSRTAAPQQPKDSSVSSSSAAAAPVWTTAVKPPVTKKSMKEIQEEEERRKKVVPKETIATAARRAAPESAAKVVAQTAGNAWTTVGPSGKTVTPVTPVAPPVRPPIPASVSSTSLPAGPSRVNGATARPPSSPVPPKAPQPGPRVEDFAPVTPSHEFLKWVTESLKGLNSSVNVEEIVSMLLSFPIDPDSSTAEIISDLIYANSTTLDGRRYASEFINKRKADAASRPKGAAAGGKSSTKPISIADVVKATPKPTQPEWGFKVVNKKKKGGKP